MGLFNPRGKPPEFPVDDSAISSSYANQVWVIQNRREIILQWCCAAEGEPSLENAPAVALALNYYTVKRLLPAFEGVVQRHELEYGELRPDSPTDRELEDRIALSRTIREDLELEHSEQNKPARSAPAQPVAGANFCRVSATPEELILDFGMNTSTEVGSPVRLTHRLVVSFYIAKSTRNTLRKVIEEYERRNGEIELDFQKRLRRR
jgi:hypothetical protein